MKHNKLKFQIKELLKEMKNFNGEEDEIETISQDIIVINTG